VIREEQCAGQRIWGWNVQVQLAGKWSETPLFSGQSIGHKRILSCAPPPPPAAQAATAQAAAADLVFGPCAGATSWVFHLDGTISDAADSTSCLTLLDPLARSAKVGRRRCSGARPQAQKWKLGFTPPAAGKACHTGDGRRCPYLQFVGEPVAAGGARATTKYCLQIAGDHPWTGNGAILWDCVAGSWDEVVAELPAGEQTSSKSNAGNRLQIDMSQGGGPKLCLGGGRPPPSKSTLCAKAEALRFVLTDAANSTGKIVLKQLAVY